MIQNKIKIAQRVQLIIVVLLFSLLLVPITALADLPPRPIPVVLTSSEDDKDNGNKDDTPVGAHISLRGGSSGSWAVVQWLGSDGNWHDVDGWRGTYSGSATWWVDKKDFGTGPFRWVIYDRTGGSIIGQSEFFRLPSEANQSLQFFVTSAQ